MVARVVVASRVRGVSARWTEGEQEVLEALGYVVSSRRVAVVLRDPRNPAENHEYASPVPVLRTWHPKFESTTG